MTNIQNSELTVHKNCSRGKPLDTSQVLLPAPPIKGSREATEKARIRIYNLRFAAGAILSGRTKSCGCVPITGTGAVSIAKKENSKLFFSGVETCGSVWNCAVCALKITQQRAVEVAETLEACKAKGFALGFVTLTTRHNKHERCKDVKQRVLSSWRAIQQSRRYRKLCEQYKHIGDIRALEVKYSFTTGFHPHLHIAMIADCTADELKQFAECVLQFWLKRMKQQATAQGQKYVPIYNAEGISNYISKWGAADELTKGHTKTNSKGDSVTPFQLLEQMQQEKAAGNTERAKECAKVFKEFAVCFKGTKQLTYSRSLLDMFNGVETASDEDIVQQAQEATEIVLKIRNDLFKEIAKQRLQPFVLNALEFDGLTEVYCLLLECGIFTTYDEDKNMLLLDESLCK